MPQAEKIWRDSLLVRAQYLMVGTAAFASLAGLLSVRTPAMRWYFGIVLISVLAFQFSDFTRRSYRSRSLGIITYVVVVAASSRYFLGFSPGAAVGDAFALVLAALLLGRRTVLTVLGLQVLGCLAYVLLSQLDLWHVPLPLEIESSQPVVLLRYTLVTGLVWGGIAFSVLFVMNSLSEVMAERTAALEHEKAALDQLRQEEIRRREAQVAKLEAEAMALQAQKMEALGQLAASVAHDFNNALLVISGWTEILSSDKTDETREEALASIREATGQSTHLARQLLVFGRREVRSPRYLFLDNVVGNAAATLKRLMPDFLTLQTTIEPDLAVVADENQLQQLIYNLVINARDASRAGGRIDLRVSATETNGTAWVRLEVEDQGHGMSQATRDRIFEPFFTTKARGSGTGLGMATVARIVEQSRGRIEVWSEEGTGTRFTISLPRAEIAPEVADPQPGSGHQQPHGKRILVVEDDPLALNLIVFALGRGGYDPVVAVDGDSALRLIQAAETPFDILCTDAVFPGASLRSVTDAFKAACPACHILVCSGYVPEELDIEELEAGTLDFLPKPFTAETLVQKVSAILS